MIDLHRREGRPLVIGHRGAPVLAPENTLRSFELAVAEGVDAVELDVLDLRGGPLVVAHSDDLHEVSHGRAAGSVRALGLPQLRAVAPELPTLDEALRWFATAAPHVGVHLDLKLERRHAEVGEALARHGLAPRAVVSSVRPAWLQAVAREAPEVALGLTYPEDRAGLSSHDRLRPVITAGLAVLRLALPRRVQRLLGEAGVGSLMLHEAVVTASAVERAHAVGAAVVAWTADDPATVRRVVAAGADGVITNDPRMALATLSA